MRGTVRWLMLLVVGVLVAPFAAAGINDHGVTQPSGQTIFGIDTPAPNATVFGIVEVRGFVMDRRGVSRITLLVDGTPLHDADINQPRDDVRRKYPRFQGEPFPFEPGFVTSFLAANFADGSHTLAIRVLYSNSDVEVLGERVVTVDNTINQAPVGGLDSPRDPVIYGMHDVVSGAYPIVGWAIDDQGIRTTTAPDGHLRADIEVMVDGRVVGQSIYGLPRPDVALAHPDVAAAANSGFLMNLDTTRFTNGMHEIAVRAWDTLGHNRVIARRTMIFDNNYSTLGPFGRIDYPMPNAHMYSTSCRGGTPPSGMEYEVGNRIEWVSGWVVDQNDQDRFAGVKYVELLLDGVILKATSRDCMYLPQFYMDVNCYGKERPDILFQYPQFGADAKYAGFFFAVDVNYLVALPPYGLGIHKGLHYLAIRVGTQDPDRPPVIIDTIPVILECPEWGGYPSFGELETPSPMEDLMGVVELTGWVYDPDLVRIINVYVDGILDGSLVYPNPNMLIPRPDLQKKYPFYPAFVFATAGFRYNLDTSKYVDGVHQLVLETVDAGNQSNYWVQRAVVFNNHN